MIATILVGAVNTASKRLQNQTINTDIDGQKTKFHKPCQPFSLCLCLFCSFSCLFLLFFRLFVRVLYAHSLFSAPVCVSCLSSTRSTTHTGFQTAVIFVGELASLLWYLGERWFFARRCVSLSVSGLYVCLCVCLDVAVFCVCLCVCMCVNVLLLQSAA